MNKLIFLLIVFAVLTSKVSGQQEYTDFQSWNSLAVEAKLHKKIQFELRYELRLAANATLLESNLFGGSMSYKISKHLRIKSGYRLNYEYNLNKGTHTEYRIFVDFDAKLKMKRFELKYRERYQRDKTQQYDDMFSQYPFHMLRHKLELNYNIRKMKLEPFFSHEIFQSLNNPYQNVVEKYCLSLGFKHPVTKHIEMKIQYRYQTRNNYVNSYQKSHIAAVKLTYAL